MAHFIVQSDSVKLRPGWKLGELHTQLRMASLPAQKCELLEELGVQDASDDFSAKKEDKRELRGVV